MNDSQRNIKRTNVLIKERTKETFPYQSTLLVLIDTLLFGEKHSVSFDIDSINICLHEGYEMVLFPEGVIELKYTNEDDYTRIVYEGCCLVSCINKYKSIIKQNKQSSL